MRYIYFLKHFSGWFLLLAFLLPFVAFPQSITTVEPPFWWAGMNHSELQLMVYGKELVKTKPQIQHPGITLKEITYSNNPNYLFLTIEITPETGPTIFQIRFETGKRKAPIINYELKEREEGSSQRQGFTASDVIYLLMPDRFANGDPDNDHTKGMLETADKTKPDGRHGGDLNGIIDHLDYFNELGVTTLWINPVLENNMPDYSYHGYAITDFYKVDPRLGSNEEYRLLIQLAHKRGLRIVKDMVFNHFGTNHWWMNDLPMSDWIHQWPEFTRSNYRSGTLTDPYASQWDKDLMLKGWFDHSMADLNQDNPFVAEYLIQNSIWWIEYAGLDGIRMDTYPYSGKRFMAEWMQRIRNEYPDFSVVGEVWLNTTPQVAYWMNDAHNSDSFNSYLDYVFDFPLKYALAEAFNEENGWSSGIARLYESLCLDFLYPYPQQLVVFADNHDTDRIFSVLKHDIRKFKMAMAFLMTVRGIPQIYYGTEILMTGWEHQGHGFIREDFPGGWMHDSVNAFTQTGLTADHYDAWTYMRLLLQWRKNKKVIHEGKTTHYIPEEGVYVYFRHLDGESIMVVLNNNNESKTFKTERYTENLKGYSTGTDVLHRTYFDQLRIISVPAMSARIIELKR